MFTDPETLPLLAVMRAAPTAMPVTTPVVFTLATVESVVCQITGARASVSPLASRTTALSANESPTVTAEAGATTFRLDGGGTIPTPKKLNCDVVADTVLALVSTELAPSRVQ
jgi:hypothetical protein